MTQPSRVRVYMATSLDGFIAGPDDDMSFLPPVPTASEDLDGLTFDVFIAQVGCMLMGRRTYNVVSSMGAWPYGDLPVLVATTRELHPVAPSVRAVSGSIESLVEQARGIAAGKEVYVDGGALIRSALAASLVDEMCLSVVPVLLGGGVRLFDGLPNRAEFEFAAPRQLGTMVQLTATLRR